MTDIVTLYQLARGDEFTFRRGDPMRMRPDGSFRAETWRDRWTDALAETLWPRPRFVVTSIDRENGRITLGGR